jgi:anaerobic ribonucleoside-triphosphate reductase
LDAEQKLKGLNAGGNLTIIEMNSAENKPEELLDLTALLMEKHAVEFLTYNHTVTYCSNCRRSWFGDLHKCPECGSIGTLVKFDRFSNS